MPLRTIDEAIEKLYDLNVGVIGTGSERHERPHKPLLLLSALDLIASGNATAGHVPWSPELRETFTRYFDIVRKNDDSNTPENPFYYLKSDGFWQPVKIDSGTERPLETTPTVAQSKDGSVFARLIDGVELFVQFPEQRARLRDAIVSRYFPGSRAQMVRFFKDAPANIPASEPEPEFARAAESPIVAPGRNPAFRKKVLEVYDYQCAACGLRIKLPDTDMTFVDGAHIMPFFKSWNDHPTNGLALCKNHHWAMDCFLVVPTVEGLWKVSTRLIAARSPGEAELLNLNGRQILPPHDDAFRPDPVSVAWRAERILS